MTTLNRTILAAVNGLKERRVAFEPGLSDTEIRRIEGTYRFRFPPDLRQFLQTALPVSGGFPNWRSESEGNLHRLLDRPLQGILFDIEHNDFWPVEWGPRPASLEQAQEAARRRFAEVPTLIPVRSQHYLPAAPSQAGNPVFLVRQSDITQAAPDLLSYLADPFVPRRPASDVPDAQDIPFWSAVARRNKPVVPNLAAGHAGQDHEYERLQQVTVAAGYWAKVIPLSDEAKGVSFARQEPTGERRHGKFWASKREFGWLVCIPCPRLYFIPQADRVAKLCITLIDRLPDEDSNRGRLPFGNFKLDDDLRREFGLVAFQTHTDWDDEREAKLRTLELVGWREMSDGQMTETWNKYTDKFGYPAGSNFHTPQPSITWDVSPAFWWKGEKFDRLEADLNVRVLHALRRLTGPGIELFALDWNHPCYFFEPHSDRIDARPSSWAVPVLPNGDHYIFLDQEFRFGLIGNCVDRTICVFGPPLIDALLENPPEMFRRPAWTFEERREKQERWAKYGWERLSAQEKDDIWEHFDQQFAFYKNWGKADSPVIKEPTPSLTWDISPAFVPDGRVVAEREADLTERVLAALKKATRPGERLHALDALLWYEHYRFDPHRLNSTSRDCWALPVPPDDTFTIILGPDFRFGVFGNPHEKTICIFGEELIAEIMQYKPVVFGRLLRRNGVPEPSEIRPSSTGAARLHGNARQ